MSTPSTVHRPPSIVAFAGGVGGAKLADGLAHCLPPEDLTVIVNTGDEVEITCTDEGIGISEEDQARLFQEFFRSHSPAVRAESGTGLGLAIVDRIVTRHGGRIEVESELGRGSTFRVFLPAA